MTVYSGYPYRRLAELEQNIRIRMRSVHRERRRAARERGEIEDDVGFLALGLVSLVRALVEKGVLTEEELARHLEMRDAEDGAVDGRLDPDEAREELGVPPPPPAPDPVPKRKRRR